MKDRDIDFIIGKPVPQPDKNASSDLLKFLFFSLLLAIPLLVYVAFSVSYMSIDYKTTLLLKRKEELNRERRRLIIELEKIKNLMTVEKEATTKLNMVKEDSEEVTLDLSNKTIVNEILKGKAR